MEALSKERLQVVENIRSALLESDTFAKVELHDPELTEEDIKRIILQFDNKRRGLFSRTKAFFARKLAEKLTHAVNKNTVLYGVENLADVKGGAIVTSNHYNPTDSTPIRLAAKIVGRGKGLHIVIQESNVFMKGLFGFLMKNANTHPVSRNKEYMVKNLRPSLEKVIADGNLLLIYPEQEMWWNYKKPRPLRDGAYHYAALFGCPIIPTFTEMVTLDGERDKDGFLPVKHILHIMPPIYPSPELSVRENRVIMQKRDYEMRIAKYEEVYGYAPSNDFVPERDIAGITADK
jgi:1-acyl-sn-glycerol-3-phosphate acyltransferase